MHTGLPEKSKLLGVSKLTLLLMCFPCSPLHVCEVSSAATDTGFGPVSSCRMYLYIQTKISLQLHSALRAAYLYCRSCFYISYSLMEQQRGRVQMASAGDVFFSIVRLTFLPCMCDLHAESCHVSCCTSCTLDACPKVAENETHAGPCGYGSYSTLWHCFMMQGLPG